jgi:hypothetical protein
MGADNTLVIVVRQAPVGICPSWWVRCASVIVDFALARFVTRTSSSGEDAAALYEARK